MTIFSDPFLSSVTDQRSTWFTVPQDVMMDSISFVRSLELEENRSLRVQHRFDGVRDGD